MTDQKYNIDGSSLELINFINKERLSKKINYKKIFSFFHKCLNRSIIEMSNKFENIKGINESIISGINMIYHIFYILIIYTNNIKLTIFLLERAILLYTEFIIMSQDKSVVDEIYFIPNINDAIAFSFKKTIGPIVIEHFETNHKNSLIVKDLCFVLRNIYKLYFKKPDMFENTNLFSIQVEKNYHAINKLLGDDTISSLKNKYYSNNIIDDSSQTLVNDNNESISLNLFLSIVDEEIFNKLLEFNINETYDHILTKLDCIMNSNDKLINKLGKIKLILFIFTKEHLKYNFNIESEIYKYLVINNKKKNYVYEEILQRFFDCVVNFDFKNGFILEKQYNSKIFQANIKNHLQEIFDFIK